MALPCITGCKECNGCMKCMEDYKYSKKNKSIYHYGVEENNYDDYGYDDECGDCSDYDDYEYDDRY